jgi:hypothetical protein
MYIIVQCSVKRSSDFFGTTITAKLPNLLTFGNVWVGVKSGLRGVKSRVRDSKSQKPGFASSLTQKRSQGFPRCVSNDAVNTSLTISQTSARVTNKLVKDLLT